MVREFLMNLNDISPSQLYINSKKLDNILKWFNPNDYDSYDAIPIKEIDGKLVFTDGHTRAYAAYIKGVQIIKVYFDQYELDLKVYKTCIKWCEEEGIKSISDLESRIISQKEYEDLWIEKCRDI
ncbi:hypothetical protein UT300003_10730 [Clostridium sardiniense]